MAEGLNNPRHLSFAPNGDLYIAEAGAPAESNTCFEHPFFGPTCLTDTGTITKLTRHGEQSRVVTGLPSLFNAGEVTGPHDVLVHGSTLTVAVGLGSNADLRRELGEPGRMLGTVVDVKQSGVKPKHTVRADLAAFEDSDPAGDGVDSNPVDLAANGRDLVAVDAGGNTVVGVGTSGRVSVRQVMTPLPDGRQAVPTAAAQGPDGAWYVSELTGAPFFPGTSTVWRITGDGEEREAYATGLSAVVDLAWHGDRLYVIQVSEDPIPAFFEFNGSLVAVDPDGNHETVAELSAPYGLAIRDDAAHVTVNVMAAGAGQVVRIPL